MGKRKMVGAAYCLNREIDTSVFFCDEDNLGDVAYAKSICARCYAREECLDVALENWEEHGIFGGLTASERRIIQFQEALRQHSEPPKIRHVPLRPASASPFFLLHTSFDSIRTPQVSPSDFAKRLAYRVNGLEVAKLLSLGSSSYPTGQRRLFEILLDQLKNSRQSSDHNFEYDLSDRRLLSPETLQTQQPSEPLFQFGTLPKPNQCSPQDQDQEVEKSSSEDQLLVS